MGDSLPNKPKKSPFKELQREFHQDDFRKVISDKIQNNNSINALFLLHGYVETFLRQQLLYDVPRDADKQIQEKIGNTITNMNLPYLALMHYMRGIIDYSSYVKIMELNDLRNEITHEMISTDINDPVALAELNKMIQGFLPTCDILQTNYRGKFNEVSKEIAEQAKKDAPAPKKSD